MVTSRSRDLLSKVELLRNQGMRVRYHNEIVGYNYRMTEYAAAIGTVQLNRLDDFTKNRQSSALIYEKALLGKFGVIAPSTLPEARHVFHQYTLRVLSPSRDYVADRLRKMNIETAIYYPIPLPDLKPFRDSKDGLRIPVSRVLADQCLSIPINPSIGKRAISKVASSLYRI